VLHLYELIAAGRHTAALHKPLGGERETGVSRVLLSSHRHAVDNQGLLQKTGVSTEIIHQEPGYHARPETHIQEGERRAAGRTRLNPAHRRGRTDGSSWSAGLQQRQKKKNR